MNEARAVSAREVLRDPVLFLAFGFGSGLAGKAPGTFGTVAAVPLYLVLCHGGVWIYAGASILFALAGIWLCGRAATRLGVHDHPGIVWDEVVGYLVTMAGVAPTWSNMLVGFLLFRLFDILKPWPIRAIDRRVTGGFGIMLDDLAAGALAAVALNLVAG